MRKRNLLLPMLASALVMITFFSLKGPNVYVHNVSAVTTTGAIGVYWNRAATNSCTNVSWGTIKAGTSKTITLYIKNQGTSPLYYLLMPQQWNPPTIYSYMSLSWNYTGTPSDSGSVLPIALTLSVSRSIRNTTNFNFDVFIMGSPNILGDVNNDGHVDIKDMAIIILAYGSNSGSPNWNSAADLNQDGTVDIRDLGIVARNYGKY